MLLEALDGFEQRYRAAFVGHSGESAAGENDDDESVCLGTFLVVICIVVDIVDLGAPISLLGDAPVDVNGQPWPTSDKSPSTSPALSNAERLTSRAARYRLLRRVQTHAGVCCLSSSFVVKL